MAKVKREKKTKQPKAGKGSSAKASKGGQVKGMSLPGGRRRASAQVNVYTVLAASACVALAGAIVVVAQAAIEVGPGADVTAAVKLHPDDGRIRLD